MMSFTRNRHYTVAALLITAVFSGTAWAQEAQSELLDELKSADKARAANIVRELERAWELSGSTSIDLLFRRGREAMEEENWNRAVEHFTAVTDHAPEFAEGYHARATAHYRAGRFGPALDDLGQALTLNPNNWNALYGLGVLFQEIGEYARAEKAFRTVLELHPHHENATEALEQMVRFGVGQEL